LRQINLYIFVGHTNIFLYCCDGPKQINVYIVALD